MALNLGERARSRSSSTTRTGPTVRRCRFLSYLAPRLGDLPVVLAVAARPGEQTDRLRHGLGDPEVLEPQRLSEDATATIVRSFAPDAGDDACRACHETTGGNAFYVREVAAAIRDRDPGGGAPL